MDLKKLFVIGTTTLLLTSSIAQADDSNFTGFSAGAFFGFSWADFDYQEDFGVFGQGSEIDVSDLDGSNVGLLVGYNYQINNYVFGLEADFSLSNADYLADGNNPDNNDWSEFDVKWTSHIRAKAGMVFKENTLVYLAAGLAVAKIDNDDQYTDYGEDDATFTGWSVGAGIEYLATENISLRMEYLYDNFGDEGFDITNNGIYDYTGSTDDLEIHTVRFGISYLF